MINQIQDIQEHGLVPWIIGLAVAGFGALFAFIKWLVGIQVNRIKELVAKVNGLEIQITANTALDTATNARIDGIGKEIDNINKKLDNHFTTKFKDLQSQIDKLKAKGGRGR